MNKQELINQGYKYIASKNCDVKTEIWAKFTGYEDIISYVCYNPQNDTVIEKTRQTISYTHLDMMAQMRDKMREDFLKKDTKYDSSCIWSAN
ncbi:MAG: hypothetical protein UHN47_03815 [Lachnospiraceae bacterium]|nr:hypothetical protein [Lachnospiraceae bacterium]